MKPAPFSYHSPETLGEATGLLAELGDDAKVIAGGQSLVPLLALRLAVYGHLVDIGGVAGLSGIHTADGALRVGATTTQAALQRDRATAEQVPLLTRAAALIGHFQIRNRGTVGGSLAHADPASELPAVALASDAVLHAAGPRAERDPSAGPRAERDIPAADFFLGTWTTALEPDEVLVAATFPARRGRHGCAVKEIARRPGDFAIAGVACRVEVSDAGVVEDLGVALFGMGDRPIRLRDTERGLVGAEASAVPTAEFARDLVAQCEPGGDVHASAAYRTRVAAVLLERALDESLVEAASGQGPRLS